MDRLPARDARTGTGRLTEYKLDRRFRMRSLRPGIGLALLWVVSTGRTLAMGSGPHPHLLYGLPPSPPAGSPIDGSVPETIGLVLCLALTGLLIWSFRTIRK
jgi:hypothetical protein